VLVYGDTNSTLAGALAAAKLGVPIAHVEAGLRSFNRTMPEEINRVVTDHLSDLLFCPTPTAVTNLGNEGIGRGAHLVGDVMLDALRDRVNAGLPSDALLDRLGLTAGHYVLTTLHRAENTDDPARLRAILSALFELDEPLLLPLHPRTRAALQKADLNLTVPNHVRITEPLGFSDMLAAETNARVIATDSGGVQKEAFWLGVPCVTLRHETEWVETVEAGWNTLVDADPGAIHSAIKGARAPSDRPPVSGTEVASDKIRKLLEDWRAA
jgi:UDP-N-acetylglucosamine 2-epimerase